MGETVRTTAPKPEFAEGIADKHDIEQGDSLRVVLHEIRVSSGDLKQAEIDETFVVDLRSFTRTEFRLPDSVSERYDVRRGDQLTLSIVEVIKEDRCVRVSDPAWAGGTEFESVSSVADGAAEYEGTVPDRSTVTDAVSATLAALRYDVESGTGGTAPPGVVDVRGERPVRSGSAAWGSAPRVGASVGVDAADWNDRVGRSEVEATLERFDRCERPPSVRVAVVGDLDDEGAAAATEGGLFVVRTGGEAADDAAETYERTVRGLFGVFVSLSPPEIRRAIVGAEELRKRTTALSEALDRLSGI